ncbi:ubiquitin-conjugating enzyme [Nitzschia inconspicua]|uniref:Ubiquitin-conjugating enzyme n=1 Tax=Nitzschia inconspicua TaxID=303405 RepID=A0A9K3LEE4_9STRA|nr:ubiquitin-conjugating enzyme [Nitzschia inconspicua]
MANKSSNPPNVVDLSVEECVVVSNCNSNTSSVKLNSTDNNDGLLEVWGAATSITQIGSRKKRRKQNHSTSAALVDAIDMTRGTAVPNQTPIERQFAAYKQHLGPLRMEFLSGTDGDEFLKTHAFSHMSSPKNSSKVQTSKIRQLHRELVQYALDLPATPQGSIFVRANESRLDLVRVLITGPEGTPYANGCFFFDFFLHDYPNSPPQGKFLTTGGSSVRFNPNLYQCGKICLSLLGTWAGPKWIPNKSTFLQVLISIQG